MRPVWDRSRPPCISICCNWNGAARTIVPQDQSRTWFTRLIRARTIRGRIILPFTLRCIGPAADRIRCPCPPILSAVRRIMAMARITRTGRITEHRTTLTDRIAPRRRITLRSTNRERRGCRCAPIARRLTIQPSNG